MADRTVSVHLKAEVATYIARIRQAGRETERFADRIERSTRRLPGQVASHRQSFVRAGERLGDGVADGYRRRVVKVERATEKVAKRSNLRFKLLASAILAGLPAASSAAFGLLATGGAAAFIGLGAVALRENQRIIESYRELGRMVAGNLADDAAVLEDEFVDAAGQIGDAFQRLRPLLRDGFAAAGPHIETLIDGVEGFAQGALPGMVHALERGDAAMEGFSSLLASTGRGIGDVFDTIAENSDDVGRGLENVGDLFEGLLSGTANVLVPLSALWAEHGDEVSEVIERLLDLIGGLAGGALPVLGTALGAALNVLSEVLDVLEPISGELGTAIGMWLSLAAAVKGINAVQGVLAGFSTRMTAFGTSMGNADRRARNLKLGLVGAALAVASFSDSADDVPADLDAVAVGMGRWAKGGRLAGEAARVLGGDVDSLRDHLANVTDSGVTRALADGFETVGGALGALSFGLVDIHRPVEDSVNRFKQLDSAMAQMVESGNASGARDIFDQIAELAAKQGIAVERVTEVMPEYAAAQEKATGAAGGSSSAIGELNGKLEKAKTKYEQAATAIDAWREAQLRATNPVFALRDALEQVDEAQSAVNKAIKEHGPNSAEAEAATWDLAEAVNAAEQAATDGDLSFVKFKGKLNAWVDQGVITRRQADILAGRVKNLRGEAEDYRGDYFARLLAKHEQAKRAISDINRRLDRLNGKTANTFITTYLDTIVRGPKNKPSANIPGIPFAADGGRFGRGDMAVVGEEGAEIVRFGGPSEVIPHRESMRLLQQEARVVGAGSGGAVIGAPSGAAASGVGGSVLVKFDFANVSDDMAKAIRKTVRVEGQGDVQVAFGSRR